MREQTGLIAELNNSRTHQTGIGHATGPVIRLAPTGSHDAAGARKRIQVQGAASIIKARFSPADLADRSVLIDSAHRLSCRHAIRAQIGDGRRTIGACKGHHPYFGICNPTVADHLIIGDIKAQALKTIVRRIQESKAIDRGIHGNRRIGHAVHNWCVVKDLRRGGDVTVDTTRRRIVLWKYGPEVRGTVPTANRIGPIERRRVLIRLVDVRKPQIARLTPVRSIPTGIFGGDIEGYKRAVLNDEWHFATRRKGAECALARINDEITGRLTGIHVQPRKPGGVIVKK